MTEQSHASSHGIREYRDWTDQEKRDFDLYGTYPPRGQPVTTSSSLGAQLDTTAPTFPRLDWAEFWTNSYEETWLIPPLLAGGGGQTVLYSAPKLGKSLLALEMAAALATGRPVLGCRTTAVPVMYVDHENRVYGDVRQRLADMGYGPHSDLSNLWFYSFPRMNKLDTQVGGAQLMQLVEESKAQAVILDTVSRVITGDENANDTWLQLYSHTGQRLKAAEVSLLRLDHEGKDATRGQRGGSAKSGDVDMVWHLEAVVKDETYRLTCEATRMQNEEAELVIHRRLGPLRHEVDATGWRGARDAKLAAAARLLQQAGRRFNVVDANAHLKAMNAGLRNGVVTKAWLQSEGLYTA